MAATEEPKRRKFGVYSIRPGSKKMISVGDAFENRDGTVEVYLSVLPIDGHLRLIGERVDGLTGQAQLDAHMADKKACEIAQALGEHKANCRHCRHCAGEAV
jgi:hypothetical protein